MRWTRTWRADPRAAALADRHYSRKSPGSAQFAPPGRCLPLILPDGDGVWVTSWPRPEYVLHPYGDAWVCTLFRNESETLSSSLIVEALAATRAAWGGPPEPRMPGELGGTLTFVDERKVASRNPGYCFLCAGFVRLPDRTKDKDLIVLWLAPDLHPAPVEAVGTQGALWAA